jgi:hypothetical protein
MYYKTNDKNSYCIDLFKTSFAELKTGKKKNTLKDLWYLAADEEETKSVNDGNYYALVPNNKEIKEFIDCNLKTIIDSKENLNENQHEIYLAKTKFLKSINEKILKTLRTIQLKRQSSLAWQRSFLMGFKLLLQNIFTKIICYRLHFSSLEKAQSKGLPIVYVLNSNRSASFLMDQLVLQLYLYLNQFRLANIFVRAKKSLTQLLNSFLPRTILNCLNVKISDESKLKEFSEKFAFSQSKYILEGKRSSDEPIFYKETLTAFLTESFQNGKDVTIQVSDHYLLETIVELVADERIYDLIIVPACVSYERRSPSLTKVANFFMRYFSGFGQIRLNFSQPYSLKEFIETNSKFKKSNYITNALSKHIKYDKLQTESIMCTNILAYILLNFYRKEGCSMEDLCRKFKFFKNELAQNYQIGFHCEDIREAVLYGLDLLEENLILKNNKTKIELKQDSKSILQLFEYSRLLTELNFSSSILACAIQCILNSDYHYLNININKISPVINENDLIVYSFKLIDIFQCEFAEYKKPCEGVYFKVYQKISEFLQNEILDNYLETQRELKRNNLSEETTFKTFNRIHYVKYDDHSDGEDSDYDYFQDEAANSISNRFFTRQTEMSNMLEDKEIAQNYDPDQIEIDSWIPTRKAKRYLVNLNSTNIGFLLTQVQALSPYIQGYLIFFSFLLKKLKVKETVNEKDLFARLDLEVEQQISNDLINRVESTCREIQKNALKYCIKKKIIQKLVMDPNKENVEKMVQYHIPDDGAKNYLSYLCLLLKSF